MSSNALQAQLDATTASPADAQSSVDNWLRSETIKLQLASLDTQRKARRAAAVLLWSAAAYVGIAAVGQVESKTGSAVRLAGVVKQLDHEEKSLATAKKREADTFDEYIKTSSAAERLQGDALIANENTAIAKDKVSQSLAQTTTAQRAYNDAKREWEKAKSEVVAFQNSRIPGDLRGDNRLSHLKSRVEQTQQVFDDAKNVLDNALEGEDAAAGVKRTTDKTTVSPVEAGQAHRNALVNLVNAKQQRARAENAWKTAQRELTSTQTLRDALKDEHDRLEREPSPMTLPVLSLAVRPAHFFLASPLLLLILYWNVVSHDRKLNRSAKDLWQRIRAQGLAESELVSTIPELELVRMNWVLKFRLMLPDLAMVASLLLLFWSGPSWLPACGLAAVILTMVYRLGDASQKQ